MGAVHLYLAQAGLSAIWALQEQSQQFRTDASEELSHVEKLVRRLLELGIVPPAVALPAVRLGRTVEEMLLIDRELEVDAIRLYEQARLYCARIRDSDSEGLFAGLLADELAHLAHIDAYLDQARSGRDERGLQ